MVDWRNTASRVRNSITPPRPDPNDPFAHPSPDTPSQSYSSHPPPPPNIRPLSEAALQQQHSSAQPPPFPSHRASLPSPNFHLPPPSVHGHDTASTSSSMSRVPGAFYIPNSVAQRASLNMRPEDGAALRRQLAFDALALVRELPCCADGWMLVKRDAPKISALFRSQWMPFWAELRGGMLLFCDPNNDDAYSHDHKRQIRLVFTATNCIIDLKNTNSYSQVKLRRTDGQCLILRVASAQEAQQWCVSLQTHTFQYTTIRLADFDWITAIGKGASGKVFLVRDNRTNARLALKVIDKTRVFRTHLTFQHVINERLVLEMCSGCPFLIQLRYAFQTDSHLYFATDFYDGGDVFSLLQSNRGKLSEHHARRIIAEIVLALSWLHERNIVYRDLKPENVVLDGDGHVRLADFGLAKVLKPDQDYLTQTICGTTAYAAPEMLQSKPYNVSLDLWCLGIFTYHVLTGRTPFNFKGRTMEEMEEMQRTRQIRYPSSLSLEAVSLIQGLLQNDPLSRSTLEDVKRHPFFRGVDWFRVAQKEPHPDDISRFVSDEEQRGSVIARLAVARAQQLGMQSESASALARTDLQDISSMTLDRYLLRNVNPEEWRHVSFSDDDDMSATAEFPAFVHKKGTEMETWAIAGWAWTCSEASGHTAPIEGGRQAFMGEGHGFYSHASIHGRRSLPSWNHSGTEEQAYTGQLSNETGRQVLAQNRASLQEQPVTNGALAQAEERTVRPSADSSLYHVDAGVTTSDLPDRAGVDIRNGSQSPRIQAFGAPPAEATKRTSSRGMLNFGRIGSTVRARVSADSASRARRSVERISKEVRARGNASISVPSAARPPTSKKHGRSSIDFILGQHANS